MLCRGTLRGLEILSKSTEKMLRVKDLSINVFIGYDLDHVADSGFD